MTKLKEVFGSQETYIYFQSLQKLVRKRNSRFAIDGNGLLRRDEPLDGSLQTIMPEALHWTVRYKGHRHITVRRPGTQQVYDNPGHQLNWLYWASDVGSYIEKCESYCRHTCSQKDQRKMQLLSPSKPLELVAIDKLDRFTKKRQENRSVVVMIDHYSKLMGAIPTAHLLHWWWRPPPSSIGSIFKGLPILSCPTVIRNLYQNLCGALLSRKNWARHYNGIPSQ